MTTPKVHGASPEQQVVISAFFARHTALEISELAIARLDTMVREAFSISLNGEAVTLSVTDIKSLRWALNALRRHLNGDRSIKLDTVIAPDFRWRGVIEGFYGNPWTPEQRLKGVEHFGDFGMNMFLVAPKDAQWQRFHWRAPLNDEFVSGLAELISRGAEHGVDVSACVSPGLSVTYSSDEDVAAVVNKFIQMANVGAKHFGLLLDDIPDTLTADSDKEKYANIAQAHADFANRVRLGLIAHDPASHVILCPMHYAGRGTEPYCHVMGEELHPQIDLMWTGREICSSYLDISDAVVFDRSTRRPPFYWDNYPVNDGSMAHRLHIAPVEGREAGLHKYSAGLLANPMELFEASLISLSTIGEYLFSTTTYDAWAAWERSLADLVPVEADRLATREFMRNCLGMSGTWAPAFNRIIGECATAWRAGKPDVAAKAARDAAELISKTSATLNAPSYSAPLLRKEIQPWLNKYSLCPGWLNSMAEVLESCTLAATGGLQAPKAGREVLINLRTEIANQPQRLFGDGFDIMLGELAAEISFK